MAIAVCSHQCRTMFSTMFSTLFLPLHRTIYSTTRNGTVGEPLPDKQMFFECTTFVFVPHKFGVRNHEVLVWRALTVAERHHWDPPARFNFRARSCVNENNGPAWLRLFTDTCSCAHHLNIDSAGTPGQSRSVYVSTSSPGKGTTKIFGVTIIHAETKRLSLAGAELRIAPTGDEHPYNQALNERALISLTSVGRRFRVAQPRSSSAHTADDQQSKRQRPLIS